jgi:hypothetical protein
VPAIHRPRSICPGFVTSSGTNHPTPFLGWTLDALDFFVLPWGVLSSGFCHPGNCANRWRTLEKRFPPSSCG